MLVFSNLVDTLFHRLCAYSFDVPGTIIVDDSGDLRDPTAVFIGWKPTQQSELNKLGLGGHFDRLFYSFNFRYYSRIEHAVINDHSVAPIVHHLQVHVPVRNTTVCSSYVKCQDEFALSTIKC